MRCTPEVATASAKCATQLEAELRAGDDALLTLEEAAAASGYHLHSLSGLMRAGRLANYGSPRRPRLRMVELPERSASVGASGERAGRRS